MMGCASTIALVAALLYFIPGRNADNAAAADRGKPEDFLRSFVKRDALYYNSFGNAVGLWCSEGGVTRVPRWKELGLQHCELESM